MSWSSRRQGIIIGGIFVALFLLVGVPLFFTFYKTPTCFDGKQNQDEKGVDCGGSCPTICSFQRPTPVLLWSRISKVVPGVYNALAYVENVNLDVKAPNTPYRFRLYDAQGFVVAERKGKVTIPPHKTIAIFEPSIQTGERAPVRSVFEFLGDPVWQKAVNTEATAIVVGDKRVVNEDVSPRAEAVVKNLSVLPLSKIELVAIISDINGNAIAFSRTEIERLDKGQSRTAVFTWPEPFSIPSAKFDVIARVLGD
jgi:hypothetical protein